MAIIALEGVNGCGKSTLIRALMSQIPGIYALNIKDEMAHDEALLVRFYARDTFGLDDELVRSLVAAHTRLIEKAVAISQTGLRVVLDRSIASFYVYQYVLSNRSRINYQLYKTLLKPLEPVLHYVWLDVDVATLHERLTARGDVVSLETLIERQEAYRQYFMQCDAAYTRYTTVSPDVMRMFFS